MKLPHMWIVIIAALIIIIVVIMIAGGQHETNKKGTSSNKPYIDARSKAILQIEFPRRKQILEESIKLIQETSNIDTLLSRYDIALEHYHWIMEQKAKGLPIWFDTEEEGFENALNRIRNYHIVRISMEKFIKYKKKMYGLKTAKARENNTAQMFEYLEKCKQSLVSHANKGESEAKLNKLHNNTEDFYSDNAK